MGVKVNFSKGVAVIPETELTFQEMGVLEKALNTAAAMSEGAGELNVLANLADNFGVDVTVSAIEEAAGNDLDGEVVDASE